MLSNSNGFNRMAGFRGPLRLLESGFPKSASAKPHPARVLEKQLDVFLVCGRLTSSRDIRKLLGLIFVSPAPAEPAPENRASSESGRASIQSEFYANSFTTYSESVT